MGIGDKLGRRETNRPQNKREKLIVEDRQLRERVRGQCDRDWREEAKEIMERVTKTGSKGRDRPYSKR